MKQTFSITHNIFIGQEQGTSDVLNFEAETDVLSDLPNDLPLQITGRFTGVGPDEITALRFATGVRVFLKSRRYMLEALEHDGSFTMRRDW
ncbi:MAG TPA: hypothetical protein VIJ38_19455 [Acidobacteriaceae bacterium]